MNRRSFRYLNPIAARCHASGDEGIAMLIVIMAMLILSSLSVLALGAIVVQSKPSQFQKKNVQTLNAAETGLDAGLSAIRNGTYVEGSGASAKTYGDRALLPCWTDHIGEIGNEGTAGLEYSVTITYFKSDPSNQTAAWRAANKMVCTEGIGTATTPGYAFISADGVGAALANQAANVGDRTLQTVYTFMSTNPNLPGGQIKDPSGLCYAGGSTIGSGVTMATCQTGAVSQMWAFTTGNQLVLTATRAADGTGGLCLAALMTGTMTTVNATMQTCDFGGTAYTQMWGISDSDPVALFAHLKGVSTYPASWCLGVATQGVVGGVVRASTSCTGVYPTAEVGAGAAGNTLTDPLLVTDIPFQWVNYKEFGRCLDITSWTIGTPSQILYPCKQDPMAAAVVAATPGWNEVFVWNMASKHFYARRDASNNKPYLASNTAYCMRSPNANNGYVYFGITCSAITSANDAQFTWTVNRASSDLKVSYTIVDSYGRCLAAGASNASNAPAYSSVTTATCDGSSGQKWNAPPTTGKAAVGDLAEVPNH